MKKEKEKWIGHELIEKYPCYHCVISENTTSCVNLLSSTSKNKLMRSN